MTVPHLQLTEDYAIVARLLDPTTERMMVVAAGIGKFGTEAAGEFLADPEHLAPPRRGVLHFEQMSNTITVRLPEDLAEWLKDAARRTGVPKGRIVREELEKARSSPRRPFLRLAGAVSGPADLSSRKGFSRK
jgi:hypothetical protein